MDFLTETDIKHAALRFLKTYYKYRPRIGETQIYLDNISDSGIIADGRLVFRTDIDKNFEASFEATSYAKSHEIKYKIRNERLWWDSITFGCILSTLIFTFIYIQQYYHIGVKGIFPTILILLVANIFFGLLYRLLFKGLSSYKEIYAIEQFKLYDANEQWVAVGIDVFENPNDKYLQELKRQCILNGFGLIVVDKDLSVHQNINPAQYSYEGKKRKKTIFSELTKNPFEGISNRFKNYTDTFTSSLGWEKERRFKYNYNIQLLLIFLSLSLSAAFLFKESQKTKERVVDESKYKKELRKKIKDLKKESNFYVIDSGYVVEFDGLVDEYNFNDLSLYDFSDQEYHYTKEQQDSLYDLLHNFDQHLLDSIQKVEKEKNKIIAEGKKPNASNSSNAATQRNKNIAFCKEYKNWRGTHYILKDGVYKTRQAAEFRISQINKASALAGVLKGGCFKKTPHYYIVYVNKVYPNNEMAKKALPFYNELLKYKGYSSGELELISINSK